MPVRLSQGGARPLAAVALAAASLVAAAAVGSIFLSTTRDAWAAISTAGPASPADGILVVVAPVGALLSLWFGLGLTLSALSALPGALGLVCAELAARIAPSAVRKVVAFVLGTALTAALLPGTAVARTGHEVTRQGAVASAHYAFGAQHPIGARYAIGARHAFGSLGNVADAAPDASFRLVRGTTRATHSADSAPGPSWSPESHSVPPLSAGGMAKIVVRRGDSLWSIAARRLGPTATTAEIDAEWRRWFAANRHVIGDDANLIAPDQLLSPPQSKQAHS